MTHTMRLKHLPYNKIKNGTKTVEMRLYDEKRALLSPGDIIEFQNTENGERMECAVTALYRYATFEELYRHHDPVSIGYEEGESASPADMLAYYPESEIRKYGVLGIGIRLIGQADEKRA